MSDKLKFVEPSDPRVELPTEQLARNNSVELPNNDKPVSDSPSTLRAPSVPPQSGPPTFTDDPLNPPNGPKTPIKSIHITELRTKIDALRAQRNMSGYPWVTAAQPGDLIKADPILELRTALDQALGPPPALGYSAGLAQGQPILAVHIQELRQRVKDNWNSSSSIPPDGLASVSYDPSSNRITSAGFAYDAAGNQTRALIPGSSSSQRFQYDAANRLVKVKADDNVTVLASYIYGDSNERLIADEGGVRTYYVAEGGATIAEYTESGDSIFPAWSKSYVYLGGRLLATLTPNNFDGESIQFHHPDRLGTRIVTNPADGTYFEQQTLPFGTALNESPPTGAITGETNRRFTSYDRSPTTKLDYAVNRHYDSQQGRFTQVDPAGMKATSLLNPQTLNLYAYCTNDPVNRTDPKGLGLISWIKKHWKIILVAVAVVVAVLLIPGAPAFLGHFLASGLAAASEGGGTSTWLKVILGASIAAAIVGLGSYLQNRQANGSGGRDPLRGDRKKQYEREKKRAKDALKDPECQKFLSDHGINPKDLASAIDKLRVFDGTTSTITAGNAGVVPRNSSSAGTPLSVPFSDPNFLGLTAGYASTGVGATIYDTYFGINGITAITIIFEALHPLTGLDDDALAAKFGLSVPRGSDSAEQVAIALANHHCK